MAKEGYHHGDLRLALLDAAEDALNKDNSRDLSIRALATQLGVSATAPHSHFKTKSDLLAALAARGFEKLRKATIHDSSQSDIPENKLELMANSYITFSMKNPGLYQIMFTTGVVIEDYPELFIASRKSYAVLQELIHEIYPLIGREERNRRALAAWGLVHGLSALISEDRIPDDIIDDKSIRALARITAQTLLKSK